MIDLLEELVPFRFLSPQERSVLEDCLKERRYLQGEPIFSQDDTSDEVYILRKGSVESVEMRTDPPTRINRIAAGHYFGERACLFERARDFTVRALEDVDAFCISAETFIALTHNSRAFAQSLGNILREKQAIFDAFDRFKGELIRGFSLGSVDIRHLLDLYVELDPALHPWVTDSRINFSALQYAVSRLPQNVSRTFAYLLTDELPQEFSKPDDLFSAVPTVARRRNVWEMLPGKDLVLLRNGVSDLIDFVSCLCLYAVEARKIRKRLSDPETLLHMEQYLDTLDRGESGIFIESLPFSETEVEGITSVWPEDAVNRLMQISFHREAVSIDIRRQIHSYDSRRTDLWTRQVGSATRNLLGCNPSELPESLQVHIISSNTHSVTNCLNPFYAEFSDEILDWAENRGESVSQWKNPYDLVYAKAREFAIANPEITAEKQDESDWGIMHLHETVSTGIQVQLVDLQKLRGHALDPGLDPLPDSTQSLLVNIDYAFGEQAEEIIRNLILLFGRNLRSINVLGKAGALFGSRGDVLSPTAFIEQESDRFYPFSDQVSCEFSSLESRLNGVEVHKGPLLTVAGTLLQNRMMLHFYRHIWSCIGLEMEGTHYYRQILESQQLGVIRSDLQMRFLYYVSDLPLDVSANLSAHLSPVEGIPPLYAITREILCGIFEQERSRL